MGVLRLFLAFVVLDEHFGLTPTRWCINAGLAVDCFYVISGYYMALLLTGPYKGRLKHYYANRLLRIWPVYLTVLGLSVLLYLGVADWQRPWPAAYQYWHNYSRLLVPGTTAYLWVSQLAIVGQEWATFLNVSSHWGGFTANWSGPLSNASLEKFLFIPQGWSLGIEEFFYLLSPLYIRFSSKVLGALLVAGLAFVIAMEWTGGMPMAGRFPLNGLSVFAAGILSFRLGQGLDKAFLSRYAWLVAALLAALIIGRPSLPIGHGAARVLLVLGMLGSLPFIFHLSADSPWDRRLGEYSYPLYVGHFLALGLVIWLGFSIEDKAVLLLFSAGVALVLRHGIEKPIEPIRRRLREGLPAAAFRGNKGPR